LKRAKGRVKWCETKEEPIPLRLTLKNHDLLHGGLLSRTSNLLVEGTVFIQHEFLMTRGIPRTIGLFLHTVRASVKPNSSVKLIYALQGRLTLLGWQNI
jgi:hypothetical protein